MGSMSATMTVSRSLIWPRTRFLLYPTPKWSNAASSTRRIAASRIYHSSHYSYASSSFYSSHIAIPLHIAASHPIRRSISAMTTPQDSPSTKTERVVIKGRVQGVFYRNWTVENAMQLGLKGWVRNRRDGSVEALFSGSPDAVGEMKQRCRRGPPDALVTGLEVFPSTDDPGNAFQRKPTV